MKELFESIKNSDYMGLKKLLKENPNLLEEEDEQGASPLAYAIRQRSDKDIIELLIEQGADIEDIDNEGVNILEYAITYGNTELVKQLLQAGVDPKKTQRRSGFTPLMAAVCYNHAEIVRLFLEQGADLYVVDQSGFSAIDFARRMHRKKIAQILQEYVKE